MILSSMSISTNTAIMSNEYKATKSLASQGVFLTVLLSVSTIPFIIFYFLALLDNML